MKGKILVTPRAFAKSGMHKIEEMRNNGWEVYVNETGQSIPHEKFVELSKDVDGILIGVDKADESLLRSCKNLKAISKYGVGVDNIDLNVANELGIKVSRAIGCNSTSVAEHAIALTFALSKNIYSASKCVKEGKWDKPYGFELNGKTIGIIGFGNIGKIVASIAQGIGMNVCAYDLFPIDETYANEHNVTISSFDDLITTSDVITIHIPLTPDSKDLFNYDVMSKMKKNAILINAARGGIVNEDDLYKILKEGKLFGAGFDVFSTEPPTNTKLLSLNNFVLTPHTASKTVEADINTINASVENLLKDLGE